MAVVAIVVPHKISNLTYVDSVGVRSSTPTPGTNLYGLVFIQLTGPFAKCAEFAIRVEGNYPAEFKWRSELSDDDI